MKKQGRNLSPNQQTAVASLLSVVVSQMKYKEDFDFDDEGETEEFDQNRKVHSHKLINL